MPLCSDGFMVGTLAMALRFCRPFLAGPDKKQGALQVGLQGPAWPRECLQRPNERRCVHQPQRGHGMSWVLVMCGDTKLHGTPAVCSIWNLGITSSSFTAWQAVHASAAWQARSCRRGPRTCIHLCLLTDQMAKRHTLWRKFSSLRK
jgi:hypothetical protein